MSVLSAVELRYQSNYSQIQDVSIADHEGQAVDYVAFMDGLSLEGKRYSIVLTKKDRLPIGDALVNILNLPIVNERVRTIVADAGCTNVEYFPVEVIDGKKKIGGFSIANVVGRHDIVDWESSEWVPLVPDQPRGVIRYFTKLVIRDARVPDSLVFRMDNPNTIIAQEALADRLARADLKGLSVTRLDRYRFC